MPAPRKKKNPAHRPPKLDSFDEALIERVLTLAEEGKTDAQIAEAFGVSVRTVYRFVARTPGLRHAIRSAKGVADQSVEQSLWSRANGYSHPAVKHFFDSRRGEVITIEYVQHYPPDTKACMFWLANRQPDKWRIIQQKEEDDPKAVKEFKYAYARKNPKKEPKK